MLNNIKRTLKHTVIYSLGNISNKLVGLILLPLYTNHLTTEEYGILSIIEITSQLLIVLFVVNLPQAMLRWCATEKTIEKEKSIVFSTFVSVSGIALLIVISFFPFHTQLSNLIFGNEKFSQYFVLLLIWFFFGTINKVTESLIRLREKSIFYSTVMVSKFTVILLVNIYFVAFAKMGVTGIVLGQIIGEIYALLITIPFLLKNIAFSFDRKILKEMLRYGLPLAFTSVSSLLLSSGDRYVMLYFLTSSSVGIYALAQKLGGVINVFFLNSFQQGFMPIAFKMFDQENSKRFFSKILTYYTLVLAFAALLLSLFSKEIIMVFTERAYYQSYTVVPFIAFAFMVKGINTVFTLGYHYSKKTTFYAVIIITGMVLNIGMNIVLIPMLGMYGAGISMLTSYIFMAVLSYIYAQKLYYIEYEIAKIFKIIIVSVTLYLLAFCFLNNINFLLGIFIKLILLISFPFILYSINLFEEIEITRLKQSFNKWKNPKDWEKNIKKIEFH